MRPRAKFAIPFLLTLVCAVNGLTNYEYFAPIGNLNSGLVTANKTFILNEKEIMIFSGAFHYFRVHPQYWRDTLRKLRAAGLNAVETYMAWNLHNPRRGVFDYGDLGEDMSEFLDLRNFLNIAKEEDLFVILRPGPYICSEWEFGGMPSWLLRDYTMQLRKNYLNFTSAVEEYYFSFASIVNDLQFMNAGPIIAMQIENEYGHFGYEDLPRDQLYLPFIQDLMDRCDFGNLLYFTSDSATTYDWGALPDVLMTVNFKDDVDENLDILEKMQPEEPAMVMEFWTGWYDYWLGPHTTGNEGDDGVFADNLEKILVRNTSVNFYMFIGGTNFGFMSGANMIEIAPGLFDYLPITTSYDYGALLTEGGNYAEKYYLAKDLIAQYNPLSEIITNPTAPIERLVEPYETVDIVLSLGFEGIVNQTTVSVNLTDGPVNIERLDVNDGNGQSYGYTLFRTVQNLPAGNLTMTIRGHVRDIVQVMIDGEVVTSDSATRGDLGSFGFWRSRDASLEFYSPGGEVEISLLVENLGRVNYGVPHFFVQKKGLWEGPIIVFNGNSTATPPDIGFFEEIYNWTATPLEFKKDFVNSLSGWDSFDGSHPTPAAYKTFLVINQTPRDTYLDMRNWNKGVVFVNGFNLGRYWSEGPQITLYIPAPLLIRGSNEFVIFEQYQSGTNLTFIDYPILSTDDL